MMAESSWILVGNIYEIELGWIFSFALDNTLKYGENFCLQVTHMKSEREKYVSAKRGHLHLWIIIKTIDSLVNRGLDDLEKLRLVRTIL